MTQQHLIKQIENKIQEIQQLINNRKQELTQQENTILALAQQLTQIKQNIQENKSIK